MSDTRSTFIAKCIRNQQGRLALVQRPNLPIVVWAAARIAVFLLKGTPKELAQTIAFGALFTWAWLEFFQGVNYFRRALGLVVLVILIAHTVAAKGVIH